MNVFPEQTSLITLCARPRSQDSAVVAILLEELRLPYTMHLTHTHHPHLPYLTDIHPDGAQIALSDVISIASYLVSHYDRDRRHISYAKGTKEAAEIQDWVRFLFSRLQAQGQTQAQAQVRRKTPPQTQTQTQTQTQAGSSSSVSSRDGLDRRSRENVVRSMLHLYLHLEARLQDRKSGGYLVGRKCTLADLIHFPAVAAAGSVGLDLERFPELTAWHNRLCGMGAVQKGMEAVGLDVGS